MSLETEFEVHATGTGVGALQLLAQAPYCSIVLDLHLPDLNGTAVIDTVTSMPRPAPIIVVTGTQKGRDVDADAVQLIIRKPADHQLIRDVLRSFCEGQRHEHRPMPPLDAGGSSRRLVR